MRVGVVGAGIYGCIIAVDLAAAGHEVDLYERHGGILAGATTANQGRLHRGYHYPRSLDTALAARADAQAFDRRYRPLLDRTGRHHYAIAAEGSKTSPEAYLAFCERLGHDHRVVEPPFLRHIAVAVEVGEPYIDMRRLRIQLERDLRAAGVTVKLNNAVVCGPELDPADLDYDLTVMATYGQLWPGAALRYEVCEVALVQLRPELFCEGVVVMDGDFVSVDPVPGTGLHMLYSVAGSVHHVSVGRPEVPDHLAPLIDRGVVRTPVSRVAEMYDVAAQFLAGLGPLRYRGSMFSVRAVVEDPATDARPVLVHEDGPVVWVLPGKLDGAIRAASRVVQIAAERAGAAVPA